MTLYNKFRKLNIDHAAIGLEQSDTAVTYFCTPKGARIIGWAGVDGIHYCTVRGFGEMIFAVSPMNAGDYVHPIARSFEDLLRLLLHCADMAALEQCYAWDEEQFRAFLLDYPPTGAQKAVLKTISDRFSLAPMEDAFAYVKRLQAEFDYSAIPYPPEYYDVEMNPAAEPKEQEWKVTYDGGFWGGRGRAGKEIPIGKTFRWGAETWHIPAAYACAKGLVVDFCMEAEPEAVKAFIEKWDLYREEEKRFTKEEMRKIEREHPLNVDFRPKLALNGKPLQGEHGSGTIWIPASCLPEGLRTEDEAKRVLEHYGLNTAKGWAIRRWAFRWATKNKPEIRSLRLTMERERTAIPAARFHAPEVGGSVSFAHPLTGVVHTLTVREYEAQALEQRHFPDASMEYPTHFVAMTYTLTPDADHMHFALQDCSEGDSPRRRQAGPDAFGPAAACSAGVIGVIGGARGSAAVHGNGNSPETLHAACSSLHFEPVAGPVEWEPVFREKLMEDVEVTLFPERSE